MIRKRRKKSKNYFTKDTELAIVEYNNEPDPKQRSTIYEEKIHYAFFKLTENIIHTFKFYYTEVDDLKDLQHEVITFLLSKMHLYAEGKGKAFSYFGTIAKRYLILSNQKNYKKRIDTVSINDLEANNTFDDESYRYQNNPLNSFEETSNGVGDFDLKEYHNHNEGEVLTNNDKLSYFVDEYIEYCTERIYTLFPKSQDAKIADSILELFRKRDNLDIFNKKALYIYIREMVEVKTPKITSIAQQLYKIFHEKYLFYIEHGYFKD